MQATKRNPERKQMARKKAPDVACEEIRARNTRVERTIGVGQTKDEAETDLYDKLTEAAADDRERNGARCSGDCDSGNCHTSVELNNRVRFRRIRRGGVRRWIAIYPAGNVRSECICVRT